MKKRLISIFLIMALLFSMTACTSQNHSTLNKEIDTKTIEKNEAKIDPWDNKDKVDMVYFEDVEAMSLEEVNTFVQNLMQLSKRKDLSPWDLYELGNMYGFIWDYRPDYDKTKFESEFCEAFDNVYSYAEEAGITLDILDPWLETPVAEVICKYLSSDNFEKPIEVSSHVINKLSPEDLLLVTKAFVQNPTMAVNAEIARSIICSTDNEEISNMAWEHLFRLSNSNTFADLSPFATYQICFDLFTNQDLVFDDEIIAKRLYGNEKLVQIASNIMANTSFDFTEKYSYFCSDFFVGSDVDVEISQIAMDHIQEFLTIPTKTKCTLVAQTLDEAGMNLEDIPVSIHEQYVTTLMYCLVYITA